MVAVGYSLRVFDHARQAADVLRILRERAGYSQAEMARLLSEQTGRPIGQHHVSKWETGKVIGPSWPVALAWLVVCGHPPLPSIPSNVGPLQARIARAKQGRPERRSLLDEAPPATGDPKLYARMWEVVELHRVTRYAVYARMHKRDPQPYNLNGVLVLRWQDVYAMRFRNK